MYIYINIHMYIHMKTYTHLFLYIYTCIYVHIYIYTHTVCTYVYIYMQFCICAHSYMFMYVHIYDLFQTSFHDCSLGLILFSFFIFPWKLCGPVCNNLRHVIVRLRVTTNSRLHSHHHIQNVNKLWLFLPLPFHMQSVCWSTFGHQYLFITTTLFILWFVWRREWICLPQL